MDQKPRQDLRIEEGGFLGKDVAGEGNVPELLDGDGVQEKRRLDRAAGQVGRRNGGILA